jgi:hypothetical protein
MGMRAYSIGPRQHIARTYDQRLAMQRWLFCHVGCLMALIRNDVHGSRSTTYPVYCNRVESKTDLSVGRRDDVLRKANGVWEITR